MNKYSDEFKLEVVNAYFESPNGIRTVSRAFGLPSKNYIERWIKDLKEKGLIPENAQKLKSKSSATQKAKNEDTKGQVIKKTAREIQLEKEILKLQAEVDYLKKLQILKRRNAQK